MEIKTNNFHFISRRNAHIIGGVKGSAKEGHGPLAFEIFY